MSDFKPCPVCQEQSDQCLSCASYVVEGERIYYGKLKDFGATKDHEIRFINRIQKHRVTAFFHNGKLFIPSRQGRSVPLAIGLQWDAWQEQQAIIDDLRSQLNNMEACYIEVKKERDEVQNRLKAVYALSRMRAAVIGSWKREELSIKVRKAISHLVKKEQALRGAND